MKEKYTKKDFLELFDRCRRLRILRNKLRMYMNQEKLPLDKKKDG